MDTSTRIWHLKSSISNSLLCQPLRRQPTYKKYSSLSNAPAASCRSTVYPFEFDKISKLLGIPFSEQRKSIFFNILGWVHWNSTERTMKRLITSRVRKKWKMAGVYLWIPTLNIFFPCIHIAYYYNRKLGKFLSKVWLPKYRTIELMLPLQFYKS